MRTGDGKYIALSITQPLIPIVRDDPDEMMIIIKCPYCGHETKVGLTYMISGFVGCENCYFEEGDYLIQPYISKSMITRLT